MEITEIVLLAAGGIIFILSFLIPDRKGEVSEQSRELVKEEIADMVNREIESVRGHVDGVVEEAVTYAMEKTERSLERLSNEKIMAVNEYSDTVLSEIHKNHEEAMFLYDMLNSKHTNLKETVSEVNRTVKEVEEKLNSLQEITGAPVQTVPVVPPVYPLQAVQSAQAMQPAQVVQPAVFPAAVPTAEAPRVKTAVERLLEHNAAQSQERRGSRTGIPGAAASVPFPEAAVNVQPSAAGRVSFLDENTADGQNNNERILKLYRQGKSKVAIAKELGLGVGEVKLVIDLFQNY